VTDGFKKLLSNEVYEDGILKLRLASIAAGGGPAAVQVIEDIYLYTLCGDVDQEGFVKIPYLVDEYYLGKA
jgi:hypothetical protein